MEIEKIINPNKKMPITKIAKIGLKKKEDNFLGNSCIPLLIFWSGSAKEIENAIANNKNTTNRLSESSATLNTYQYLI